MTEAVARCPLCDATEHEVAYDLRAQQDALSVPGLVARCRRCPMWFKIPERETRLLDKYAEGYADAEMNERYMLGDAARAFFRRVLQGVERTPSPARPRLLDIGTGLGALLEEAQALGFEAEGLDVSEPLVARALARGLRVRHGSAETLNEESAFDVVTLLDVIEHVPEPRNLLLAARRLLKPGGELVVYTPNHRAALVLLARALHRVGVSFPLRVIFAGNHLGFFDDRSLPLLLRRTGFDVRRTVRFAYDPARAGLRLSPAASAGIRTIEWLATPVGRTFRLLVYARPCGSADDT